jgi:hypothetical protein
MLKNTVKEYTRTWCAIAYLSISSQPGIMETNRVVSQVLRTMPREDEVDAVIARVEEFTRQLNNLNPQSASL